MSSGELVGHFRKAKPCTPLQSDGAWVSPMISVVDPLLPGSACRPLWPVTSPRSGRAAPRSARLAGPSRSVTLGQRQRSPSSQHHQGGAGERSCWPRSGRPEGPRRCRQPSRPAGAGRRGAAGGPPWSRRPGRRRLTEPPRPPARPAPGSDRPGGSGRSGPASRQAARPRAVAARSAGRRLTHATSLSTIASGSHPATHNCAGHGGANPAVKRRCACIGLVRRAPATW